MWTHRLLSCPQPPQKFIDLALTMDPTQWGPKSESNYYKPGRDPIARRKLMKQGKELRSIRMPRYDMPEEFAQWILDNITDKFQEASIVFSDVGDDGGLGPHTDRCRDYCLMYVVKSGGPDVRTRFWHQHNQDLLRNRFTFIDEYDTLDLIDEANFIEGQWFLMCNRILHSVEHIIDRRLAFQINIDTDISDFDKFYVN